VDVSVHPRPSGIPIRAPLPKRTGPSRRKRETRRGRPAWQFFHSEVLSRVRKAISSDSRWRMRSPPNLDMSNALTIRLSSSIDKYRNQIMDPKNVAADLDVDSFTEDGDDLRITAQSLFGHFLVIGSFNSHALSTSTELCRSSALKLHVRLTLENCPIRLGSRQRRRIKGIWQMGTPFLVRRRKGIFARAMDVRADPYLLLSFDSSLTVAFWSYTPAFTMYGVPFALK
jgi:hypothetical protein